MIAFPFAKLRLPFFPHTLLEKVSSLEQLYELFQKPELREAIYLASPNLFDEFEKNKPNSKLTSTLLKYVQRATTRCTPFGLFASCSAVYFENNLKENPKATFKEQRHTRLDMNYLCSLAQFLSNHHEIKKHLVYFPNSDLYKKHDKIRYTESKYINNKIQHQLSSVDFNPYLQLLLSGAEKGLSRPELIKLLINNGISPEEANNYVSEVIDAKILISNLEPSVTGMEFIKKILLVLEPIDNSEVNQFKKALNKCNEQLEIIDTITLGNSIKAYKNIGDELNKIGLKFEWKYLFQTDLFRKTDFKINNKFSKDLWSAITILGKLSFKKENKNLEMFREAFSERYGDREVPLLEVLDVENGLGYPCSNTYENNLATFEKNFHKNNIYSDFKGLTWHKIDGFLLTKITEALRNGLKNIEIKDSDIKDFIFNEDEVQDTISALVSVTEFDCMENKPTVLIKSVGGSSGVNLLGRFCHGSQEINDMALAITNKEQELNPDIIFAEIVHLPESRTGNVILRPQLRKFEISYLAKHSVEDAFHFELGDLVVFHKSGKLFLRSLKADKIIIPRLSTAHNYSNSALPIYLFLCDLQSHYYNSSIGLDMTFFQRQLLYIPRITYRNFIFSPARWKFRSEDFGHLLRIGNEEIIAEIRKFRDHYQLPQIILLAEGDNELYVNLEDLLSIKCLFESIKGKKEVVFLEFLYNKDKSFVKTDCGGFNNEFILFFHKEKKDILLTKKYHLPNTSQISGEKKRVFIPGSEWLYFKIYSGPKTIDKILVDILMPLSSLLKNNGSVEKSFFIRYLDPELHIRFRLLLNESSSNIDVIKSVSNALNEFLSGNLISKIQLDTYEREIERYNENNIEITETLFNIDSDLCFEMLNYIKRNGGEDIRWQIGLLIINLYLDAFNLDIKERIYFTSTCKLDLELSLKIDKDSKIQIDEMFRMNRTEINILLSGNRHGSETLLSLSEILIPYVKKISTVALELGNLNSRENLIRYLKSYVHMSINRLFQIKQRTHELILYSYLNKFYNSQLAKENMLKLH